MLKNLLNNILNKFYKNIFNKSYYLEIVESGFEKSNNIILINSQFHKNFIKLNYNYPKIELNSNRYNINYTIVIVLTLLFFIQKNYININNLDIKFLINDKEKILINDIKNENIKFTLLINSKNIFNMLKKIKIKINLNN